MGEDDVAELKAKLKVAEQEMEDAKEALRIERAKMTREKKQWALDRKAEEKRWAEDMAQLSREKRIWAEEKEKLASPRDALQSEKDKWNQERRSLMEQHRMEIDELNARLNVAASSQQSEDAPSASHENGELERSQLEHELEKLRRELETTRLDLAKAEHACAEAERERGRWEAEAGQAQQLLHEMQRKVAEQSASAEIASAKKQDADKARDASIEMVDKAHREALKKSQAETAAAQAMVKDLQAELESTRGALEVERDQGARQLADAAALGSRMDEEVGETRAEREKWQQKKAILERAHIQDMVKLKEEQAELREGDLVNFRSLLKEEQDKLRTIETAWKGLLAGTHDAQLSYNTQRLSTGKTLLHVTCATVRQIGEGTSAKASNLRVTGGLSARASQASFESGLASARASAAKADQGREGGGEANGASGSQPLDTLSPRARPGYTGTGEGVQAGSREGIAMTAASLSQSLAARWESKGSGSGALMR